ncbi:transcription factor SPT20 homolog isoform X2 [Topomyia yanbarensis]|uniref:transcription factor SPT20 homolog isoform X2 n=1 Tax=Topomyia yanbarensis TaxID=2498891 RepID=UPI00273A81C7|nr:transcription factor SPT20 homolog isoform X2 [Topomyia yanbarensis]
MQQILNSNSSNDPQNNVIVVNQTTISPQPLGAIIAPPQPPQQTTGTTTIMNQSGTISSTTTNPSALIKSLLANKVTTVTSNESAATISSSAGCVVVSSSATSSLLSTTISNTSINPSTSSISTSLTASNVNVHQVAQRQQLMKQKQLNVSSSAGGSQHPNSSVVVTSNSPNNLTNIKVGNSTISIKPGTLPTNTVITATNPQDKDPPPLAPLTYLADGALIKPVSTNKMLVDLLDKQTNDPPVFAIGETTVKRKSDVDLSEPPTKKLDLMDTEEVKVTPKAADLYAELAGSILADEDLEDIEMKAPKEEPKFKVQPAPAPQVITMPAPLQRQIIMNPSNPQQMLLSSGCAGGQQLTAQTTATIKTDTGYQTVPVILQHNQSQLQLQKTASIMQPTVISNPPQPTQYILATNPQGQTYVVAQQQQPQPQLQQTVLLTQGPQHGSQQKTIIILQQPTPNTGGQQFIQAQPQTPQKVFVNQQGQQIIMTQMPRQMQHQTILTSPGGQIVEKKPIYITTNQQGNTISIEGPSQQIIKAHQPQIIQTHLGQQQSTSQQIQQILQQSGSQTFQIIQQPQQHTVPAQPSQQIMIQPQSVQTSQPQIVIQSQPPQQLQPQIISQQIIQSAPQQQQQQIGQKLTQQKLIQQTHLSHQQQQQQQQQQQIITIQKQPTPQSPASKQLAAQSTQQLPTKTIIVQQQAPSSSGSAQKQIIQVVQQKISTPHSKTQSVQQPQQKSTIQSQATIKMPPQGHIVAESMSTTNASITPPTSSVLAKAPLNNLSTSTAPTATTIPVSGSNSTIQMIPAMDPAKAVDEDVELSWPWLCDWRGCPRKKYASANEVYMHACAVHCPDTVDSTADIYCQWGPGPNLCDNLPRKRFSLMTHIFDRHCTSDSFKMAVQRRITNATTGILQPQQAYPVTLVRQPGAPTPPGSSASSTTSEASASPSAQPASTPSQGPGNLSTAGPAALHAIKRHAIDWANAKEFQDDIEGPVTKSIRLTSALILRNLVVYNNTARRNLRAYEPHLAGMAMNNVEASRTISQVLFEMNDTQHNF